MFLIVGQDRQLVYAKLIEDSLTGHPQFRHISFYSDHDLLDDFISLAYSSISVWYNEGDDGDDLLTMMTLQPVDTLDCLQNEAAVSDGRVQLRLESELVVTGLRANLTLPLRTR
jgi:hypothetical protein